MIAIYQEKGVLELNFNDLKKGDIIYYSGELIVMRDAAHKRIKEFLESNKELPLNFKDKIIFYAGPSKKPDFQVIGAVGPTTSKRMDSFLEMMYQLDISATIGKGERSDFVNSLNKKYKKVYFVSPSGTAASLSQKVLNYETIAFEDLGTESIQRLVVKNFPLYVMIDSNGK